MAYAFNSTHLFVLGGKDKFSRPTKQFFSIDLSKPWTSQSPSWNKYQDFPADAEIRSGGFTVNGKFIVAAVQSRLLNIAVFDDGWGSLLNLGEASIPVGQFIATNPMVKTYIVNSNNTVYIGAYDGSEKPFQKQNLTIGALHPSAISWSIRKNFILFTYSEDGLLKVGAFDPNSNNPPPLQNQNAPSNRTGHCFVPNENGSVYYVFGGIGNSGVLSEVWAYNVDSGVWSHLPLDNSRPESGRSSMACAVKGNTLVIWGGFTGTQPLAADNVPLLYDTANKGWVDEFNPTGDKNSPHGPIVIPSEGNDNGGSSNLGAIIGGVVGGLALIAILAGLIVVRRRRMRRPKDETLVLSRSAPAPMLTGKNIGAQVSVPLNEYTTIRSPFVGDDHADYQRSTGAPPLYAAPALQPISAPLSNHNKNNLSSIPVQPYSMPFAPPIPTRPGSLSGSPTPPKIQSPFEVETEPNAHYPLLQSSLTGPVTGSLGGFSAAGGAPGLYQSQNDQDDSDSRTQGGMFSPSMDNATVDLIPVEASEVGDHDHSRSNSLVSSRLGPGLAGSTTSGPVRNKSHEYGNGTTEPGKTLLEDETDNRRDSTDTLEYLDLS
ncbi:hypothetical protein FBU30_007630 [Linnemannia zychae]|nr:hypothetical protein FBU30_007630 [Linnemannia zychae]